MTRSAMLNSLSRYGAFALAGLLIFCLGSTAQAELLAYDPFLVGSDPSAGEYIAGTGEDEGNEVNLIAGQDPTIGPTAFYAGPWIQSSDAAQVVKDIGSLSYPLLPTQGGQIQETTLFGCCTFGRNGREMTDTLGTGRGSNTIYQSFLIDFGEHFEDTEDKLADGDLGHRAYEMWNGGVGDDFLVVNMFMNGWGGVHDLTLEVNTPVSGTQSQVLNGGGLTVDTLSGTNFFVFRFDFHDSDPDVVTVYHNPTDSIESNWTPAAQISVPESDLFITHHGTLSQFSFKDDHLEPPPGHSAGAFDEVRWGTTFESVTPFIPEPTSFVLLSLGGLGLLSRRRYK